MNRIFFLTAIILLGIFFILNSCKKEAGEGGNSSIRGKVHATNYNATMTSVIDSAYSGEENVYIIYGSQFTYGDRQDSNNDGAFEFKYLRKGKYKVYVYSKSKLTLRDDSVVTKEVEITEKKQTVELKDIRILR